METFWEKEYEAASDPDAALDIEEITALDDMSRGSFVPTEDAPEEELPEEFFDPDLAATDNISDDLRSLINLGKLTDHFSLWGHSFDIRTLRIGEELEVGLVTDRYKTTNEAGRAYATATVAAALSKINGQPVVVPLGPDADDLIAQKFDYVTRRLHWPIIRKIYERYIQLVERQEAALTELEKK